MLHTWESIIQKYNSIGHTSRATKNLEEWGELFASAYIVNADKADKLWQELIELNVATDEKFAKYFVAQIFNAIISRLDAEDAIAFLIRNEKRLALFLQYKCGYQGNIVNGILCFYIKNEKFEKTSQFFTLFNAYCNEGKAFADSPRIAQLIATVSSCALKVFDGDSKGVLPIKIKKDSLINYLIWQKDLLQHTLISYVAEAYLIISNYQRDTSAKKIEKLLTYFSNNKQEIVFWSLLYHQRNCLDNESIVRIILRYQQQAIDKLLFKEWDDSMTKYEQEKWAWVHGIVAKNNVLAFASFESKQRSRTNNSEDRYFTDLIVSGKINLLVYFMFRLKNLAIMDSYYTNDYLDQARGLVREAVANIKGEYYEHHITLGGKEVTPSEYYGDMYRLTRIDRESCIAFAVAINYLSEKLYGEENFRSSYMAREAREIAESFGLDEEFLEDEDLLESIDVDNVHDALAEKLEVILREIENRESEDEVEEKEFSFSETTINESNIGFLVRALKKINYGFQSFFEEAQKVKPLSWSGDQIVGIPIIDTNQVSYGMLTEKQLAFYLYFRDQVKNRKPLTSSSYYEPYICILGTELLLSLWDYSESSTIETFEWLSNQFEKYERLVETVAKFKTDYQSLHHIKIDDPHMIVSNANNWERNNAIRSAVANGYDSYLYMVVESNSKYRVLGSAFIEKANYLKAFNTILNDILVLYKNALKSKGIDLVKYLVGSPWEQNGYGDTMSQFVSPALCSLDIIKEHIGYKPNYNDVATAYSTYVHREVYQYDESGVQRKQYWMQVPCMDDAFSEYAVKYVEKAIREIVGYQFIIYPKVEDTSKATIYVCKNRSYDSKIPMYAAYHNSLIREYAKAYDEFDRIADSYITAYYEEHSDELEMLKSVHAAQTFEAKKTYAEKVADMVSSVKDYEKLMTTVLDLYKNAKPTTQRTKGTATFNLLWNLWMLHGTESSSIQPGDILAVFKDKEAELVGKNALLSGNFEQALPWLKSHYNYSISTAKDTQLLDDCLVITCHALDIALSYYNINFVSLILGEEKATPWDLVTKFDGVALTPTASAKDISGVEFYEGLPTPTVYSYQPSELNRAFTRYLIKCVEQRYFDVKKIVKNPPRKEFIQGIFDESKHDEIVSLIDSIVYNIAIYTINRRTPKQIVVAPFVVKVGFDRRLQNARTEQQLFLVNDLATDVALNSFCAYYGVDQKEVKTEEPSCEGITFNPTSSTYKDFLEDKFVTEAPFVQAVPKMVLTRFYQLYDSYYEQLDELFSREATYDSKFAIFSTKLMRKGDGFVGKDLYQFAMLKDVKEEGEDFLQWIEHIKHGTLTFPNFQAYVVLWYYYILNGKLFAEKKDLGLALMCKIWNHYLPSFSDQDANLILGWIKDYWMIYCPTIPLDEFKRLFNRKIVFANEYSISGIYKNGLLAYYNDICYYRVLSGKLVESGHRDIFEKAMRKVNVQIEMLCRRYDVSFKKMLALAAGKNQYLFLRAIVDPKQLRSICNSCKEKRISDYEAYSLTYNSSSNRYQWIFSTGEYDIEFLRLFFEYIVKATERELRVWLGMNIPKTFNVDIEPIYQSELMPSGLTNLFKIDSQTNEINRIIKQCVEAVCVENNIDHPGVKIKSFAAEKAEKRGKYRSSIDYSIDYGGIDLNGSVSETSLEEARRVLRGNQGKLVVEDESTESVSVVEEGIAFNAIEIEVLKILLFSNNVISDFNNLQAKSIIPSVVITQINEKAADLYGDLLIDEDTTPPSIIEENREICLEVISDNE